MDTVWVIDFGTTSIRALALEQTGRAVRVRDFSVVPLSRAMAEDERKEALKAALSQLGARSGRAYLTWEEGLVFRQLVLPDMPSSELEKAFLWEMKEKYLFSGEESLVAYEPVAELPAEEGSVEKVYNVFYCDKRTAMERVNAVQSMGLKPAGLVPGQSALASLCGAAGVAEKDTLLFDIGQASARILVVRRDKSMLSRTVLLGGHSLTEMMTGAFSDAEGRRAQYGLAEAEAVKREAGASNPQAPYIGLVRPYLEKIVSETKRSVDFYETQKYSRPIAKVLFTGGGSALKGLDAFMSRFLGIEASVLTGEGFVSPSMPEAKRAAFLESFGSFAAAVGAAQPGTLDLLPREEKDGGRLKVRRSYTRVAAASAAIFSLFFGSWSFMQWKAASTELASLDAEEKEVARVNVLLGDVESQQGFMRAALMGDLVHPALLKMLSHTTPDSIYLERVQFSRQDGTLEIEGLIARTRVAEVKVIAQYINELMATPFFKDVSLQSTQPESPGQRTRFLLKCATAGIS